MTPGKGGIEGITTDYEYQEPLRRYGQEIHEVCTRISTQLRFKYEHAEGSKQLKTLPSPEICNADEASQMSA